MQKIKFEKSQAGEIKYQLVVEQNMSWLLNSDYSTLSVKENVLHLNKVPFTVILKNKNQLCKDRLRL